MNSNQKQRWLASSLSDIEPRLNKIHGCRYLPELREAIRLEISKVEPKEVEKLRYVGQEAIIIPVKSWEVALC